MQFLCIFPLSFSSFKWKYMGNQKKNEKKNAQRWKKSNSNEVTAIQLKQMRYQRYAADIIFKGKSVNVFQAIEKCESRKEFNQCKHKSTTLIANGNEHLVLVLSFYIVCFVSCFTKNLEFSFQKSLLSGFEFHLNCTFFCKWIIVALIEHPLNRKETNVKKSV